MKKMKVYNPVSAYRIQFNKDFTFSHAEKIVSYLHKLGIRTIYASPVLQAGRNSMHGYDVMDPLRLNKEIGTKQNFEKLISTLHGYDMGWIQDIVPNHMAYSTENPWIYDVLCKGSKSKFYSFFDIIKDHPDKSLREKIMLPFFGKSIAEVTDDGELSLQFGEKGFSIRYFENEYPVSYQAYPLLLSSGKKTGIPAFIKDLLTKKANPDINEKDVKKLCKDFRNDPATSQYINKCLAEVNSKSSLMKDLAGSLAYLPVYWKETEKRINYRRFFTINSLICLNMDDSQVFATHHKYIQSLLKEGYIDGLRIDHIDGLADPDTYLEKLRDMTGPESYIIVEKILEEKERLPEKWPVQGSTGYDFLAMVNNLLINEKNENELYTTYRQWTEEATDAYEFMHEKKRYILFNRLKGELEILSWLCQKIRSPHTEEISPEELQKAIAAFLIAFPVYKMYSLPSAFTEDDKDFIRDIFEQAVKKNKGSEKALKSLEAVLLLTDDDDDTNKKETIQKTDLFFRRCMQFTGPLMAKGIEDTAFYSYNPFIASNEVGDNPRFLGISTEKFHRLMEERQLKAPLTMNTGATHDTKRGEDARARLNVISDIPHRWDEITKQWKEINRKVKSRKGRQAVPSDNDEYFIYQTLCAHLPMNGKTGDNFIPRLKEYLVKALRESKANSSWSEPDTAYENKTLEFTGKILSGDSEFLRSFTPFINEIIPHGIINSLCQLIIKNTVPGVPDTFQGTETWNLNFVDPDNRRPVDYKGLEKRLDNMIRDYSADAEALTGRLWQNAHKGDISQWITYLTLQERVKSPELFLKGDYIPLEIQGKYKNHIISFMRKYRDEHLLIILPLHTASMDGLNDWGNTRVRLPDLAPPKWENSFTKKILKSSGDIMVKDVFEKIPFGILRGQYAEPKRKAGILMHVSSLPGKYGIGDLGPGALKFIDFLERSGQSYWQVLPLSQSDKLTSYSPYSSYSAFAGNTLFIDPAGLVKSGLTDSQRLEQLEKKSDDRVDYPGAEKIKNLLLDEAFLNYKQAANPDIKEKSEEFQKKEKYWLNDFALYSVLKKHFDYKPWNRWPEEYRDRHPSSLKAFQSKHKDEIQKVIFSQLIFSMQWQEIRDYARERNIDIFGDIPIYIDYDSADVWANPGLFMLNEDKSMKAVAGVPPDYFNEKGQLWGMPLFNWEEMKKDSYRWWVNRIKKNMEWFDLLRLDHFRAFSAYWQVPAKSETAIKGKWVKGPGTDLFDTIKKHFPDMPFVAEDLGQIDQDVYKLRDHYKLPGMRVLQFGFEENMPYLQHTPLNYTYNSIAYTGTHDNNTMKGWYRKEADKENLKRFKDYTGKKLKEENCHTEMIRMAYSTVSRLVIIPMQDWLGLDESSRMNYPSSTEGNWLWRLKENQLSPEIEKRIRKMVKTFGRI
ncbi:MAG: malto-oligosyltrehalose synthase [Bacteroidales bacterium]|nr:malto-oligosyltrehalose synthase [Bacteroidales bacterium]